MSDSTGEGGDKRLFVTMVGGDGEGVRSVIGDTRTLVGERETEN